MKVSALAAALVSFAIAQNAASNTTKEEVVEEPKLPLENCLYCRYVDLRATMLESWSYCAYNQECLADEWNYIDRGCPTGW